MLYKYKCMVNGHDEQQIIGICENVNCRQQYRKVCFECQEMHSVLDQQFKMTDIKNDKGIQKIIEEFKQDNIKRMNNIYAQCHIQQYFITLQFIQNVEQFMVRFSQLAQIVDDLDKFQIDQWRQVNLNNYIQNENNIGIYKYLQLIQDKLQYIDRTKDNYIININNIIVNQELQILVQDKQREILAQLIPILLKNKENIFQKIIKNDQFKKEQINQNPFEQVQEMIKIQGQTLKTNILLGQYNSIQHLLIQDKEQENCYRSILQEPSKRQVKQEFQQDDVKINQQDNKEKSIQLNAEGDELYLRRRYEEAIAMYQQAIDLDPTFVNAYIHKGNSQKLIGRLEDAKKTFIECLKIDPNNKYVKSKISFIYLIAQTNCDLVLFNLYQSNS